MDILSDRIDKVEDLFEDTAMHDCGCITGQLIGTDYNFFKDVCHHNSYWFTETGGAHTFEDVLDNVDDETRAQLLFHLDVFTSNDPEKIWSKGL